jgi:hypothetical protein
MITKTKDRNGNVRFDVSGYGIMEENVMYNLTRYELSSLKADIEAELWDLEQSEHKERFESLVK